jgi:DNA-binding response OmpR family regulator
MPNRILVVDDEKYNLTAIKRIFLNDNYITEFAMNGKEALERVSDFEPDLVILDIMMPGINGYEVCSQLKSHADTSGIMVLLLSAKSALEDRLKGYKVEADDYLVKPYDPEELRAKVRILVRLKNAQDELRILNQNLEKLVENRTRELVKKERQALVGQMVQGFIHNLQSPITAVCGRTELALMAAGKLSENQGNPNIWRKQVEQIIRQLDYSLDAADKVDLLIDNLLAKGRDEAEDARQELNLNDLIVKELEFLDADMELKHEVKKNFNLDPSLPSLFGIYSDFSQVIYNMITNASDAMKNSSKKELAISTRHDNANIYIEFQDTGAGILPADLERIFDPFFTTKPKKGAEKKGYLNKEKKVKN